MGLTVSGGKDDPINQKGLDYYSNLVSKIFPAAFGPFATGSDHCD